MRKLIVGLMAVGLLAVAGPAMAQGGLNTGMGDPLGLINSGAVIPYVGNTGLIAGSQSFLEVTSPVRGNSDLHMFFFSASCVKGPKSLALPQTANDEDVLRIDNREAQNPDTGLITMAAADVSGQSLVPLQSAVHARVYWVADGFVRILEPIWLDHFEFPGQILTWNPLRTGASFFAPLEANGFHTSLILICPTQAITGHGATPAFSDNSLTPFPVLLPVPVGAGLATTLQGRVYNDEETFLRDFQTTCNCLTQTSVLALDSVYSDPDPAFGAPFGTYTEIETTGTPESETGTGHAFTGYRAIRVGGVAALGGVDVFGRLDNANIRTQQGQRTFVDR